MKKSIVLIGILSVFLLAINTTSCNENRGPKAPESKRMELDSNSRYYDQQYKVYTLEGCEYLVVGYGDMRWGSHKGNCKNPIHYHELKEELVDSITYDEKHFDCYVTECNREKDGSYEITTECGIVFYSEKSYKKNEILKKFISPKHR